MNISEFNKCANCGACYNICPKKAITVKEDEKYYTLSVNEDLCVDCGLCVAVCPVNNEISAQSPVFAAGCWHKDPKIVNNSSSGGMFHALANKVIAEGGVVFGASYTEDYKAIVFSDTDNSELSALRKSKYVESLVGDSFIRVMEELEKGRKVLFCATPCQIAGLKCFLRKEYDSLVTCDFACGGLPSHKIYSDYLTSLEKKYRSEVSAVDFRPKTHGWQRYAVLINFENGKSYNQLGIEDEYLRSFLYGKYTVRDYCLECKFSNCHCSDITLADFWLHKKLSSLENSNGISLVLCNTQKGKNVVEKIKDNFVFSELDVEAASYNNKPTELIESTQKKQVEFRRICDEKGLREACKYVLPMSFKEKIKNLSVRVLKRRKDKK